MDSLFAMRRHQQKVRKVLLMCIAVIFVLQLSLLLLRYERRYGDVFKSRWVDIQERCRGYVNPDWDDPLLSERYKYDDQQRLIFCENPKVASTTWQNLFLKLTGFKDEITKKLLVEWAYKGTPTNDFKKLNNRAEAQSRANSYTSFFITRHPFERLVSAYYDKLTSRAPMDAYKKKVGTKILQEENDPRLHGIQPELAIGLADILIAQLPSFKVLPPEHQKEVLEYSKVLKLGEVTFPQFVKYLLMHHYNNNDLKRMDVHWKPQMLNCHPCTFNYTYVMKFEKLAAESQTVLDRIQKDRNTPKEDLVFFPYKEASRKSDETTRLTMAEISEQDVEKLREIYSDDFRILGYDPHLYKGH